jgi:hypothetical protein
LWDERWVGMGVEAGEGRTHLQMSRYGRWVGERQTHTGQEYYVMSRKIIAVSRTPNTCQILASLGKNVAKTDLSLLANRIGVNIVFIKFLYCINVLRTTQFQLFHNYM